jgi:hypothetical protein
VLESLDIRYTAKHRGVTGGKRRRHGGRTGELRAQNQRKSAEYIPAGLALARAEIVLFEQVAETVHSNLTRHRLAALRHEAEDLTSGLSFICRRTPLPWIPRRALDHLGIANLKIAALLRCERREQRAIRFKIEQGRTV